MTPLSERLKEWQDFDTAQYHLGVVLGVFDDLQPQDRSPFNRVPKWLLWTNNPLANTLGEMLHSLVAVGMLEYSDDSMLRWNTDQAERWQEEWKH